MSIVSKLQHPSIWDPSLKHPVNLPSVLPSVSHLFLSLAAAARVELWKDDDERRARSTALFFPISEQRAERKRGVFLLVSDSGVFPKSAWYGSS